MIRNNLYLVPALLLICSASVRANENTLIFGCSVMSTGGGIEVVFADANAPIPLADGSTRSPSSLVGERCATVLRLLRDNDLLIDPGQLGTSSHLVINTERQEKDPRTGIDADVPDSIIWDIDIANAHTQLICDVAGGRTIVEQESGVSSDSAFVPKNYLGWKCLDALADLGGLSDVVRTSTIRPWQAALRQQSPSKTNVRPGSIVFYQLSLKPM